MRVALGLVMACALGLGGWLGARAAEPAGGAPLQLPLDGDTTAPNWRTPPSREDLEREFPPLAALLGIAGHAVIRCEVEVDGRVDECHVLSETPAGMGFGAAAVRSAAYFSMIPATLDGKPTRGDVTIPLTFHPNDKVPPEAMPILAPTSPGALDAARRVVALEDIPTRMHNQWRPWTEQMSARVVLENEAQAGEQTLDALRQGLDDAIAAQVDWKTRQLAGRMSEADLRATEAYMSSPAGKAWLATTAEVDPVLANGFMPRLSQAIGRHLCATAACAPRTPASPAAPTSAGPR